MQWMTLSHHLVRNFRASTTLFFFSLSQLCEVVHDALHSAGIIALFLFFFFFFFFLIPPLSQLCEAVDDLRSPISWYETRARRLFYSSYLFTSCARQWIMNPRHQLVRETRASKALLFFFSLSQLCEAVDHVCFSISWYGTYVPGWLSLSSDDATL